MSNDGLLFHFGDLPSVSANSLMVRVPAGMRAKQKILGVFADRLRFPFYFGWNWDAFEECLHDLSWLPEEAPILVIHEDVPFGSGENRPVYLAILNAWACSSGSRVRIVFPPECETEVRAAAEFC